jgi:UDP-glucose 4-epimerase
VNIGTTEEISIGGLAQLVKQRANSNSPIVSIPYDQAYEPGFEDMLRRVPALEKLEGLTGFRPSVALHDIIDSVIAYFQDKGEPTLSSTFRSSEPIGMAAKSSTD